MADVPQIGGPSGYKFKAVGFAEGFEEEGFVTDFSLDLKSVMKKLVIRKALRKT